MARSKHVARATSNSATVRRAGRAACDVQRARATCDVRRIRATATPRASGTCGSTWHEHEPHAEHAARPARRTAAPVARRTSTRRSLTQILRTRHGEEMPCSYPLRMERARELAGEIATAESPARVGSRSTRVLVVEDEHDIAALIKQRWNEVGRRRSGNRRGSGDAALKGRRRPAARSDYSRPESSSAERNGSVPHPAKLGTGRRNTFRSSC